MSQIKAEYIDHMGDDLRVVNAARVSFDKESDWDYPDRKQVMYAEDGDPCDAWEDGPSALKGDDSKLIRYLAKHGHWTPFSHPQITLRETVPIFVARQRFKHMVGFTYNEVSRRYVDDEPEFYVPDGWRKRAENVKQGSSEEEILYLDYGLAISDEYDAFIDNCVTFYNELLKVGVCPEQARMVLPQSMMTSYYVTGSLAAFARAYKQRADPHAQREIQLLAEQWDKTIRPLFPISWEALTQS